MTIISILLSATSLTLSILTAKGGIKIGENKPVVISKQYDKGKSLKKAQDTKKPTIVFFYTDWCGYCQRFAPTYHKIAKNKDIKKNFAIAYVNCEEPKNHKLMEEYNVNAFPTVFVINKKGKRIQLENNTFFNKDSAKTLTEKVLELIGEEK